MHPLRATAPVARKGYSSRSERHDAAKAGFVVERICIAGPYGTIRHAVGFKHLDMKAGAPLASSGSCPTVRPEDPLPTARQLPLPPKSEKFGCLSDRNSIYIMSNEIRQPADTSSGRLRFIDGLRGVAACMVMFYHLGDRTGIKPITEWGYLGVGIFFVISGFVITSTLLNKDVTVGNVGRFFARRFVRLDIPYWTNIAVTVFLGAVLYRFGGQLHYYSPAQIAVHLVYLQDILGFKPINDVYWTLCLEIQFYLTLVAILWVAQRLRRGPGSRGFQIAIIASALASVLFSANLLHPPRGLMFPYWWAFALGAMTCWWRAGHVRAPMLTATFVVVMMMPFVTHESWRLAGALTAGMLVLATVRGTMGSWLAGPIAQFLGRISYSLYLFHALIGWEAQTFASRYVGPYAALTFGIIVSVVSGWLAYIVIERPAVALSHRIRLERPARKGAAVAVAAD